MTIPIGRHASLKHGRSFRDPSRRRWSLAAAAWFVGLTAAVAIAQQPAPPAGAPGAPAAGAKPAAPPFSKEQALEATINALALNGSDAAWESLRKVVTGEIDAGTLDRPAAQAALARWVFRSATGNSPEADAFLIEALCQPETIRPAGRGVYTADELRADLAAQLSMLASPKLRAQLAERFSQQGTPPQAQAAIGAILKAPIPVNIPLQAKLVASPGADPRLKGELIAALISTNEDLVNAALGFEVKTHAAAGAPGNLPPGMPQPPAGMTALPPGFPAPPPGVTAAQLANGAPPAGNGAAETEAPSTPPPAGAIGGLLGALKQVISGGPPSGNAAGAPPAMPAASASTTQALWSADFAASLVQQMEAEGADRPKLLGFLASLPVQPARLKLHEFLEKNWSEGPADLAGAAEDPAATGEDPFAAPAIRLGGGRRKNKRDDDDDRRPQRQAPAAVPVDPQQRASQILTFGENWHDPGALVVLKSFPYTDRPPLRPGQRPPTRQNPAVDPSQRQLGPAAQRREEERQQRLKALEAKYDWCDAIERYVYVLNERFAEVAQETAAATDDAQPAEDDSAAKGASTPARPRSSSDDEVKVEGLSFSLHAGAKVTKDFRGEWPASSGPGSSIHDPMTVRYLRAESTGSYARAVTHYRTAIQTKPIPDVREIEDGRWIDVVQEGSSPDRTRSIDVIVTRTAADETDRKPGASKDEALVVQILVVEIPHVEGEKTKTTADKR